MSLNSIEEKKEFIRWFLHHYTVKKPECAWLLNYFMSQPAILENIYFVPQAKPSKLCIFVSTKCVNSPPFLFYQNQAVSHNVESAYQYISQNMSEPLYIVLDFRDCQVSNDYISILEDHERSYLNQNDKMEIERFLDFTLLEFQKQHLKNEIDKALDKRNKRLFTKPVKQLLQLEADS